MCSPIRFLIFSLLFCVAAAQPLRAAQTSSLEALAASPGWQALMHINRGSTIHSRGESYVDDEAFFLAENGAADPLAELLASRDALAQAGAPARCRFPARLKFIGAHLDWELAGALDHCADYQDWSAQIPRGRAVLVFPASYLNSPSSMFGHTLMRLDKTDNPDSVWESWAVNFGAAVTAADNSIFYIYRGLGGGYPGHFSIVPYVTKIQEYANLENRDMWEYTLDLTDEEMTRLIDHLWELQNINFDYYFLDENCSFRLLELIDVARPGTTILDGFRVAEAPVNTVRVLDQEGMIADRYYRPSKAMQLQADVAQLDRRQQRLASQLQKDPAVALSPAFLEYDEAERHLMARVAYQALRFHHRKGARAPDVSSRSFELLRIMNENQAGTYAPAPVPPAPESGHGTQRLRVGGGQVENRDFGELGYRFTYHDLIDNNPGFLRGAQIEGLDLLLRSEESGDLKLESLDVVHIRSHSPRSAFVRPISWFVHGGIERAQAGGRERLVRFVHGGPGLTWSFGPLMPYGFMTARLENNSAYTPLVQAGGGAQAGMLLYLGRTQWDLGSRGTYFGNDEYRYRHAAAVQIRLGRQSGLRLEGWQDNWRADLGRQWLDDHENGFSLSWQHYID